MEAVIAILAASEQVEECSSRITAEPHHTNDVQKVIVCHSFHAQFNRNDHDDLCHDSMASAKSAALWHMCCGANIKYIASSSRPQSHHLELAHLVFEALLGEQAEADALLDATSAPLALERGSPADPVLHQQPHATRCIMPPLLHPATRLRITKGLLVNQASYTTEHSFKAL